MDKEIEYAKNALVGKFFISNSVGYIDDKEFWNENISNRTFQIYAHSLYPIHYLTYAYINKRDTKYAKLAEDIFKRWLNKKNKSHYSFHEYPVLSRLRNTLYFINNYTNHSLNKDALIRFLNQHINFLLDDNNYKKNNHGIMMDNSLMTSVSLLPKELFDLKKQILSKVIIRSREAIDRDYSSQCLHLENSPDYHRLATKWLFSIESKLNDNNYSLGDSYVSILKRAEKLDEIIVMPNNRYPILGDSSDGFYKGLKSYEDFVDIQAGRAILHNKSYNSQLTFVAGYGRKGHKHFDDLSFIFYDGVEVVFSDSGKYNYEKDNHFRNHVISPLGHNSLSVYKENYKVSEKVSIKKKVSIDKTVINDEYKIIKAFNYSYNNVELFRTLIYFSNNSILIYDQFDSPVSNTVAVNFNLGLNIDVEKISRDEYHLIGRNQYVLKSHLNKFTSVQLNNSIGTPCIISSNYNKYEQNKRVLLRLKTKKSAFLTSIVQKNIDFHFNGIKNDILDINFNKKNMIIDLS